MTLLDDLAEPDPDAPAPADPGGRDTEAAAPVEPVSGAAVSGAAAAGAVDPVDPWSPVVPWVGACWGMPWSVISVRTTWGCPTGNPP